MRLVSRVGGTPDAIAEAQGRELYLSTGWVEILELWVEHKVWDYYFQ